MTPPALRLRLQTIAILLGACCLSAGALAVAPGSETPVVLGVCEGKAGETPETKTAAFALAGESSLKLTYDISPNPEGAAPKATVRLQRKLPNGTFVTVKTLADLSQSDETEAKPFPAGDYRLDVTATQAAYRVSAVRE